MEQLSAKNAFLSLQQNTQHQLLKQADHLKTYKTFSDLKDSARFQSRQERIDSLSKDFEAMFMKQMLDQMFDGVRVDELTGGGKAENIYRGMLMDAYSKEIAERGQLGIADSVKRQILAYEQQPKTPAANKQAANDVTTNVIQ